MQPVIVYEKSAALKILEIFGKSIDKDGYVVEKDVITQKTDASDVTSSPTVFGGLTVGVYLV